jgi:hypothetical protein
MVGGEGPPTGRLLAAALVLVGLLGVALNALVIAGVRQAQQYRNQTHQENKDDRIFTELFGSKN